MWRKIFGKRDKRVDPIDERLDSLAADASGPHDGQPSAHGHPASTPSAAAIVAEHVTATRDPRLAINMTALDLQTGLSEALADKGGQAVPLACFALGTMCGSAIGLGALPELEVVDSIEAARRARLFHMTSKSGDRFLMGPAINDPTVNGAEVAGFSTSVYALLQHNARERGIIWKPDVPALIDHITTTQATEARGTFFSDSVRALQLGRVDDVVPLLESYWPILSRYDVPRAHLFFPIANAARPWLEACATEEDARVMLDLFFESAMIAARFDPERSAPSLATAT